MRRGCNAGLIAHVGTGLGGDVAERRDRGIACLWTELTRLLNGHARLRRLNARLVGRVTRLRPVHNTSLRLRRRSLMRPKRIRRVAPQDVVVFVEILRSSGDRHLGRGPFRLDDVRFDVDLRPCDRQGDRRAISGIDPRRCPGIVVIAEGTRCRRAHCVGAGSVGAAVRSVVLVSDAPVRVAP